MTIVPLLGHFPISHFVPNSLSFITGSQNSKSCFVLFELRQLDLFFFFSSVPPFQNFLIYPSSPSYLLTLFTWLCSSISYHNLFYTLSIYQYLLMYDFEIFFLKFYNIYLFYIKTDVLYQHLSHAHTIVCTLCHTWFTFKKG